MPVWIHSTAVDNPRCFVLIRRAHQISDGVPVCRRPSAPLRCVCFRARRPEVPTRSVPFHPGLAVVTPLLRNTGLVARPKRMLGVGLARENLTETALLASLLRRGPEVLLYRPTLKRSEEHTSELQSLR